VIIVFFIHTTCCADEFCAQVTSVTEIFLFLAFSANIGACFSHEAETIISPSISFSNDSLKFVSSQYIASKSEKII
jgi:hypothetical protein